MSIEFPLVVHATHEAGIKVGGIGAVLAGLLASPTYNDAVGRTILVGPMAPERSVESDRLLDPDNGLSVLYSSRHGVYNGVTPARRNALQVVERTFGVAVLYGKRRFGASSHEVILVDGIAANQDEFNHFKYYVWEHYGLDCGRYEVSAEFNRYFAIAQPIFAVLKTLGADRNLTPNQKLIIAHEWMGMPVVFAAQLTEPGKWRSVFYAYEVATARRLVEERSGHDTCFYNALTRAQEWNINVEAVFGPQDDLFKHPIVRLATRCDNIFAVGDRVVDELRFLGGRFGTTNIDLVYNGIVADPITLEEKATSRARMQQYCENLFGYRPDYIFTHVSRMVLSKAFWRDLRVLEFMDPMLHTAGKTAVYFVLATASLSGRHSDWIRAWEEEYGWPVDHRADNGDLVDQEVSFFVDTLEPFNRRTPNVQAVLVNQFGWNRERCGERMPADMTFADIRKGTDLEFGQSIYEPFGIAQLEPLGYGALSCLSNVCGCVGFVNRVAGGSDHFANLVVGDYVTLPQGFWLGSPYDAVAIDQGVRSWIEENSGREVARQLMERLPRTDEDRSTLLAIGAAAAEQMSWENVIREQLLPGMRKAVHE